MKKVTIKQDEKAVIDTEVLANEIVAISQGMQKLRAGKLTDRALFLLVQNAAPNIGGRMQNSPISIKTIRNYTL